MDHSLLLDPLPLTALILSSLALLLWALLRPRSSGLKDEPPLVRSSPAFPFVPFIGPAIEFGKSPVLMAKRCYEDYGPVFTVPVSLCINAVIVISVTYYDFYFLPSRSHPVSLPPSFFPIPTPNPDSQFTPPPPRPRREISSSAPQ